MALMTQNTATLPAEPELGRDRTARILDAAERCFARSGIHRTTMQDVAAEAGMSPGNLYRYFRSKDTLAAGLAERDRARVRADFSTLLDAEDFFGALSRMAYKHFAEEPRERAVLCLEIWAEATRNRAFADMTEAFDMEVTTRMTALFREAQERGVIAAGVDPQSLAIAIATMADGLFVRRAVVPSFDAAKEVEILMKVIEAACAGRIDLPGSSPVSDAEVVLERAPRRGEPRNAETRQ
jgi:AcrR family transcriptional regulator